MLLTRAPSVSLRATLQDEIVAAYVAHGKRSQDAAFDPNWEVCYEATRACTKELASHPLSDFTDDMEFESGDASAAYTSEVMPSWSDGDGVLLDTDRRAVRKVVAGSFLQDVILSDEAERLDVLLYLSFPFSNKEFHESASLCTCVCVCAMRCSDEYFALRICVCSYGQSHLMNGFDRTKRVWISSMPDKMCVPVLR